MNASAELDGVALHAELSRPGFAGLEYAAEVVQLRDVHTDRPPVERHIEASIATQDVELVEAGDEDVVDEATKRCHHCRRTLPLRDFNRDGTRTDGLRGQCRDCQALRRRAYVAQTTLRNLRRAGEDLGPAVITKRCPDCGQTKPAADFTRALTSPNGLCTYCRPCVRIRSAARRQLTALAGSH